MKIICLVPSITETLLHCGVNVVARSRFCIHPAAAVSLIPAIGGTKDVDWAKAISLEPDLVILDKEENTLPMAESCPYPYIALHITGIADVAPELQRIAQRLSNDKLNQLARRWQLVTENPHTDTPLANIPGISAWWRAVEGQQKLVYLIWRDPWMAIGEHTFIQSMLDHCGLKSARISYAEKYPAIDLTQLDKQETLLLFSSEPYPFARYQEKLTALGYACALIDGELYSWYGVRALQFLESLHSHSEKSGAVNQASH
jgi:iron complex transport system substrate-binding protein